MEVTNALTLYPLVKLSEDDIIDAILASKNGHPHRPNSRRTDESDESKLTENDIIVRYRYGKVEGLTIIGFSKRQTPKY